MNGLHITGMKLSSPAPAKKLNGNTTTVQIKPKQPTVNKSTVTTIKKPATITQTQKSPTVVKKESTKKVQQKIVKKKQQPIKKPQEQKKQEIVTQKIAKQEEKKVEQPPVITQIMVRYNHYKQKFPCVNGVLSFAAPNEKYCFALVFKGNYQPILRNFKTRDIIQPINTGKAQQFSWKIDDNQVYEVQIQQDQQQESKYERHVYKAPQKPNKCCLKKNQKVQDLTNQMKNMGVQQLGTQKHRQLLQQRDLQDILFS